MGKKIQELEEQLEARTLELELSNAEISRYKNEVAELTKKAEELSGQIKEFRSKEQAISWALTEAKAAERRILEEAEARIKAMESEAKAKADAAIEEAKKAALRTVQKAEASVLEYEQNIKRLNAELVRTASEAQEQAQRFAGLISHIRPAADTELIEELKGYGGFSDERNVDLPENYGSPAELMQNIYKIQGREISGSYKQEATNEQEELAGSDPQDRVWRVDDLKGTERQADAADDLNDELNSIIDEVLRDD
jgi:DNA repair exonuclease SbcCD ATPase subunit